MPLQLGIFSRPTTGELVLDATPFVTSCTVSTNEHGSEALNVTVKRSLYDAFRIYNAPGLLHVALSDGARDIGVGRLEEPGLRVGGTNEVTLNALGYWRALSDLPYTALWSDTSLDRWRMVESTELGNRTPERYDFRTENGVLEIAPKKGETFGGNASPAPLPAIGSAMYFPPSGNSRQITLVQCDIELMAPTGWRVILYRVNTALSGFNSVFTITSAGAVLNRSIFTTITPDDRLMFDIFLDTAGTTTASFDTGTAYLRVRNLRVSTSFANIVNTTFTVARAAGTSVTATVGTTDRMYVGMKLVANSGGNPSETVVVQSVTNSTQFVATFVNSYAIGNPLGGSVLYADEIIRDMVSAVTATNPTQLQSVTSLIASPGRDSPDVVYEDATMADVATDLAKNGNTANAAYEVGVDTQRRLYFRPRGSAARTWYIDSDDLNVTRALDGMFNSGYAKYQNASGATVRGATSTDATSVQRYGITRRRAVDVQTTDATYATNVRDAALTDDALVEPRASYTVTRVFGTNGAPVPLSEVRACDVVTIRNLPPAVLNTLDTIRTFRLTRTTYDPIANTLSFEPEAPMPTLDVLVGGKL